MGRQNSSARRIRQVQQGCHRCQCSFILELRSRIQTYPKICHRRCFPEMEYGRTELYSVRRIFRARRPCRHSTGQGQQSCPDVLLQILRKDNSTTFNRTEKGLFHQVFFCSFCVPFHIVNPYYSAIYCVPFS